MIMGRDISLRAAKIMSNQLIKHNAARCSKFGNSIKYAND